jgi:deoxyribodipyrimidine photo-lyase
MGRTIVWFRRDLRVSDHLPLFQAAAQGEVIPLFILDRALLFHPETGVARVAFMLDCLQALDADLRALGGRLILRSGDPVIVIPQLLQEAKADGISAHLDYERIYGRVRDARVNQVLAEQGLKVQWFEPIAGTADLLVYPDYRRFWYRAMAEPLTPTLARVRVPKSIRSEPIPGLAALGLVPDSKPIPPAGTEAARQLLQQFLAQKTDRYYWQLSLPSAEATSGLSPHLKFGVISSREVVQTAQAELRQNSDRRVQLSIKQLISRLRWGAGFGQRFRYLPQLELRSLYTVFDQEGWAFDPALYHAWQVGETGFPIIDAAAKCLQQTGGWLALNFRTRAIYASFLSNLLGIDWRYGALHFMRHLIDGDCPIDHYQWAMQAGVTHCLDKSWTRIYNPAQAAVDRCDPDGAFIKRWLPELSDVPAAALGIPPPLYGYPPPLLDYRQARQQRVQRLAQQRQVFRQQPNVLPFLAPMPISPIPFGAQDFASEVDWARVDQPELFPPALDLDQLDAEQGKALRTWLVAHLEITPRQKPPQKSHKGGNDDVDQISQPEAALVSSLANPPQPRKSKMRKSPRPTDPNLVQLELWE